MVNIQKHTVKKLQSVSPTVKKATVNESHIQNHKIPIQQEHSESA